MSLDKYKTRRYQTLDRCFADQTREYFWEDLQEACRRDLAEAGMLLPDVSRRTIFNDIQEMESNSDWNIELLPPEQSRRGKRRFYRYADPHFSIWKKDLTEDQLMQMKSILLMLRQFDGLPQYDTIEDIIGQLEDKYGFCLPDSEGCVAFEVNENTQAMSYLARFFSVILKRQPVSFTYQPFGKEERRVVMHPYFLKQYNRRWFAIGGTEDKQLGIYALDRITSELQPEHIPYRPTEIDFRNDFFYDLMGVTPGNGEPQKILLEFDYRRFPYVESKPLHPSQRILSRVEGRVEICVVPTKELYQQLLSFGPDVEVISPANVRDRMRDLLRKACEKYAPVQKDCTEEQ